MDIGVYYAGKFTTREDLSYKERLHFLELLALLDMGPRTALVLMVAVGAQLSTNLGLIPLNATAVGMRCAPDSEQFVVRQPRPQGCRGELCP